MRAGAGSSSGSPAPLHLDVVGLPECVFPAWRRGGAHPEAAVDAMVAVVQLAPLPAPAYTGPTLGLAPAGAVSPATTAPEGIATSASLPVVFANAGAVAAAARAYAVAVWARQLGVGQRLGLAMAWAALVPPVPGLAEEDGPLLACMASRLDQLATHHQFLEVCALCVFSVFGCVRHEWCVHQLLEVCGVCVFSVCGCVRYEWCGLV